MKKETLVYSASDRCINIVANTVESLRINNDVQNTVRVYNGGNIGVCGTLGNADFAQMEQQAIAQLSQGISYPETHQKPVKLHLDTTKDIIAPHEFVSQTKQLLDRLAKENPQFLFGNKVQLNSSQTAYTDSDGTDLLYKGNEYVISLTIKHKGSANITDEFYSAESNYFDQDKIAADVKMKCDAFLNKLPQIEGDEVTVISGLDPLQYILNHFVAELYFRQASLLSGKLGQKVFNNKFSLSVNRHPDKKTNLQFFDVEGVVNPDFCQHIVQNGELKRLITCKKSAAMFNTENLGSADASYNGVPSVSGAGLYVTPTAESLSNLVSGKAVYVSTTGGGDMTSSGDIALPCIVGYLYEDGKLVGRLPEFTVAANVFDLLGDNFAGVTEKGLFEFGNRTYLVYKAKLVNKQ